MIILSRGSELPFLSSAILASAFQGRRAYGRVFGGTVSGNLGVGRDKIARGLQRIHGAIEPGLSDRSHRLFSFLVIVQAPAQFPQDAKVVHLAHSVGLAVSPQLRPGLFIQRSMM